MDPSKKSHPFAREARQAWACRPEGEGIRVGAFGSFSLEALRPYIGGGLLLRGFACQDVAVGPYNQIFQTCHDPGTAFGGAVHLAVLLFRIEDVFPDDFARYAAGEDERMADIVRGAAELAAALCELRRKHHGIIVAAIPPCPGGPACDLRDLLHSARIARLHRAFVDQWLAGVRNLPETYLLDMDSLQRSHGEAQSRDARKWFLYRQPYAEAFLALLGEDVCRIYGALRAAPRKCLVLDCDNTLWGGVVGEDGLAGIQLGEDFPGVVYREFQKMLLALRGRGVFLAIASKNDEQDVWDIFEKHDGMLLRREHLSAWRINWQSKAENLRSIAAELNIGLDSFVFVDDSPFEIEEVRQRLPEVACMAVPEELADFPEAFASHRFFDRLAVTGEDLHRCAMQRQESSRKLEAAQKSHGEFLESLQLVVEVFAAAEEHVNRIVQLINKTNQFNLSSLRRDQAEVAFFLRSPERRVYALRARDRFGDYGIIGVACCLLQESDWRLDTFLLSCRALGRGMEHAFMAGLRDIARGGAGRGMQTLFRPTAKNSAASSFLPSCNFQQVDPEWWAADLDSIPPCPTHIRLVLK
jgi:FkbH-like protein